MSEAVWTTSHRQDCPWAIEKDLPAGQRYCQGWNGCTPKTCHRKKYAQAERRKETSAYRQFPGRSDRPATAGQRGHCQWCGGAVMDPKKGQLNLRRGWHDGRGEEPDCLYEFYCHTRAAYQLTFLIERDGPACRSCGKLEGGWVRKALPADPEKLRAWGAAFERQYPADVYVAETTYIAWSAALQVGHVLALSIVVLTVPEAERWAYWGPKNLQGLCHDCHVAKTANDRRALAEVRRAAA